MTKDEYIQLKQQVEEKYSKTVSLAERERSDGLKAIETVWNMLKTNVTETNQKSNENSTCIAPIPKPRPIQDDGYGSFTAKVKDILLRLNETFTKRDIMDAFGCEIKDNTLNGCLFRLERQGIIKIAKRGKGRTPTKYHKTADLGLNMS